MQSSDAPLRVSVVYALPERQVTVDLEVQPGCTVAQAVARSGLLVRFPEAAQRPLHCAIYNRPVSLEQPLESGDRVEVLRPLLVDPKESRRQAAASSRRKSSG